MASIDLSALLREPHREWRNRNLADSMRKSGVPAMGICVLEDGDTSFYCEGCEDTDLFQTSALSQLAFSVLIVRMAQDRMLDLHADLSSCRIVSRIRDPKKSSSPLTLAQLLSHSAGIRPLYYRGYRRGQPLPDLPQMLEDPANPVRQESPAGKESVYSAAGYLLAQAIAEEILGQDLETLARRYLFEPLGMEHSSFTPEPVGNTLPGYGHFRRKIPDGYLLFPQGAAAGLWSCTRDMAHLLGTLSPKSGFLDSASLALMTMPYNRSAFSLGMACGTLNGDTTFNQIGGGHSGYQAKARIFPKEDRGLLLLADSHAAFSLMIHTQYVLYDRLQWPYLPGEENSKRRKSTDADQI